MPARVDVASQFFRIARSGQGAVDVELAQAELQRRGFRANAEGSAQSLETREQSPFAGLPRVSLRCFRIPGIGHQHAERERRTVHDTDPGRSRKIEKTGLERGGAQGMVIVEGQNHIETTGFDRPSVEIVSTLPQSDGTNHPFELHFFEGLQSAAGGENRLHRGRVVDEDDVEMVGAEEAEAVLDGPEGGLAGVVSPAVGVGADLCGEPERRSGNSAQGDSQTAFAFSVKGGSIEEIDAGRKGEVEGFHCIVVGDIGPADSGAAESKFGDTNGRLAEFGAAPLHEGLFVGRR